VTTRVRVGGALAVVLVAAGGWTWWQRDRVDPRFVVGVQRGTLTSDLTVTGTLRPVQSITYRSPVPGRELEITSLVAEGSHVREGDLIAELDTTELQHDLERQRQELRQLQLDLQVAHGERQEAEAAVKMVAEGEGALSVEEARASLRLAEKKRDRLQQEYDEMKPLLEKGFITRDELMRTASDLDQADQELALVRKKAEVVEQLTHPREKQRAALQLAQKNSQVEAIVTRVEDAEARAQALAQLVDGCRILARGPGLVVYEQFLNTSPRRKIRVGDRVTSSQGIVTIPEVNRMTVEASVTEADMHRVHPGQPAAVTLEAYPGMHLAGKVSRVGTLASSSIERPMDEKRFDLVIDLEPGEGDLRPEMTARADIRIGQRENVLMVPVAAVAEGGGVATVSVVGFSGSHQQTVQLGESNGVMVEVRSGLTEHDRLLLVQPAPEGPPQNAVPSAGVVPGARGGLQLR
jgi:multidrug efflux pump subunit AcrA (membrane-fusion protein)